MCPLLEMDAFVFPDDFPAIPLEEDTFPLEAISVLPVLGLLRFSGGFDSVATST